MQITYISADPAGNPAGFMMAPIPTPPASGDRRADIRTGGAVARFAQREIAPAL